MRVFISYSGADRAFAEQLGGRIQALGADISSDQSSIELGMNFDGALREALESSDGVVLVVPAPGSAKANTAFFEAGAARALGKPVVAVIPRPESSRIGELPADLYGLAVFDGSRVSPEALARSVISALNAAQPASREAEPAGAV